MFRTRLLSGILLVIIALATIMAGNGILAVVLCLISLIAYGELVKACGTHEVNEDFREKQITAGHTSFWFVHGGLHAPEYIGMFMTILYYILLYCSLWYGRENGEGYIRSS